MIPGRASVIIPAYNYGRYLTEAVESVQRQTYQNWDITIVDDGSTDNTPEVGKELEARDPARIKFIRKHNEGVSVARNVAIAHSEGEFIMPLDADDILMPSALAEFVEALRANPRAGYAFSNLENLNLLSGDLRVWEQGPFIRGRIVIENTAASASMWRRSLFDTGVKYRPLIFEDWDLWLQIVAQGYTGAYVPESLFQYRLHVSGRTSRNRYLYFPALLQMMLHNPTLYDPALVRWATSCLAHSPECWKKLTIVFLPMPGSASYTDFVGPMAECARTFARAQHFVACIGAYPPAAVVEPGVALMSVPSQDLDAIFHKLGMIGSSLLVFSALPAWMNKGIQGLKNVSALHSFSDQTPTFEKIPLIQDAERAAVTKRSEEERYWNAMKRLDAEQHTHTRVTWEKLRNECTAIIPTRDPSLHTMARVLAELREADAHIRIVVSDFGSRDAQVIAGLPVLCKNFGAELVQSKFEGPYVGGRAFNVALQSTQGEWVLFLPDTVLVSPNIFERFAAYQAECGTAALYVGEAQYLPPLSMQELSQPYEALSRLAQFRSEVQRNLLFLPRQLLVELGGLAEEGVGDAPAIQDIEWHARAHALRLVWLSGVSGLKLWNLELTTVAQHEKWESILKQRKQFPRTSLSNVRLEKGKVEQLAPVDSEIFKSAHAFKAEVCGTSLSRAERAALLEGWGAHCLVGGEHISARHAFEDALALDATRIDTLVGLGHCAARRGAVALMGHYAAKILRKEPSNPTACEMMAYLSRETR